MGYRYNGATLRLQLSLLARVSLLACTILTADCQDSGGSKPDTTADNANRPAVGESTAGAALPPETSETIPAANHAPVIAGTSNQTLNAGSAYQFAPQASDADGDTLAFSIANKPVWATFNTSNGRLAGTPDASHAGSYANIVISVSDGKTNVALAAFTITVVAVSNGSAALSWTPPTQNVDGSALTNLAGYKIYYGTSAPALNQTITINSAGIAQYVVDNLSPATWYFAIKAVNSSGVESNLSATVSKKI